MNYCELSFNLICVGCRGTWGGGGDLVAFLSKFRIFFRKLFLVETKFKDSRLDLFDRFLFRYCVSEEIKTKFSNVYRNIKA